MVSAKRLAQMAKSWQRMAVLRTKRLARTTTRAANECCLTSSVAVKGHCIVYTAGGGKFEVPLPYLSTALFSELLTMSLEEFGFVDSRITPPCDAAVMKYAFCLLRSDASAEVVKAFLSSVVRPCSSDGCVLAPCIALPAVC